MNEIKVSINHNGLLSKKITFKRLNEYDRFQWTCARYRHFHKWQVETIHGRRHRATLQNYKATWTSLLTNEKAKSTFTRRLLRPNRPPTWALLQSIFWTSRGSEPICMEPNVLICTRLNLYFKLIIHVKYNLIPSNLHSYHTHRQTTCFKWYTKIYFIMFLL